ncbi:MAG: thiosulfate oxidation carrier protein SoxY [Casimicrobiaceae bacterium]|nr:thiosulfate oxidation carrier protein SoxY [Casimicrobiaceae bacterium]MCX8097922.1 thiosulfate oxidation carrier protein SoxY [Casimicrobiaceae bacterium]MDW8312746.1 thiosulfate oxidation carrier protein SoxY [Burkholderiales bacterium]
MRNTRVTRREVLKAGGSFALVAAAVASGLLPESALANWNKAAYDGQNFNEVLKALGGSAAERSNDIIITAPDIAENGMVVPISVQSRIPNTQSIAILVEKNPRNLAATFDIPAGTEPNVGTRVKMGQSSNVHALVKAGDKFYVATKEVKVTLGGCGG